MLPVTVRSLIVAPSRYPNGAQFSVSALRLSVSVFPPPSKVPLNLWSASPTIVETVTLSVNVTVCPLNELPPLTATANASQSSADAIVVPFQSARAGRAAHGTRPAIMQIVSRMLQSFLFMFFLFSLSQ